MEVYLARVLWDDWFRHFEMLDLMVRSSLHAQEKAVVGRFGFEAMKRKEREEATYSSSEALALSRVRIAVFEIHGMLRYCGMVKCSIYTSLTCLLCV